MGFGSQYVGNPTAAQSPDTAPSPGKAPSIYLPSDLDGATWANLFQAFKDLADNVAYMMINGYAPGMFGDGSDGNLAFDGSATVLGLAPSSSVYTATRDIYANNLTVTGASTVLYMGPYRLYVKGTLTSSGGAKISASGNAGADGTNAAGAAVSDGTVAGSAGGGAGGTTGTNGTGVTNGFGGAGGLGGLSGGNAGGSGGTVALPASTLGTPRSIPDLGQLVGGGAMALVRGGGGGGGGAGGGPASGGGGAGGVLCISARTLSLANASDLIAAGGRGGNSGGSNCGGGGGGGGGVLIVRYGSKNAVTFSSATNCPGGAGGTKTGAGVAGAAGSNGTVFELQAA